MSLRVKQSQKGDHLIAALKERLGSDIDVVLEFTDELPRISSEKFRWVASMIN